VIVSLSGGQISSTQPTAAANTSYLLFTAIFLLMTSGLKLSWGDYSTWLYGILCGVVLGLLRRLFAAGRFGNTVAK